MNYELIQGDCLTVLKSLPANSVQCCVTSPPYYGLRDYGVDGQIGLEETPDAYVAKLVDVFREVRRVLRDDGTLWLNLGDSYGRGTRVDNPNDSDRGRTGNTGQVTTANAGGYGGKKYRTNVDAVPLIHPSNERHLVAAYQQEQLKPKDLIGIPWMVAFALRADGWWLRSEIIWHKKAPMPESVTDRPTKAHEQVFLLSKSANYFYDAEAIAEPISESTLRIHSSAGVNARNEGVDWKQDHVGNGHSGLVNGNLRDGKRNRRSVWTLGPEPYAEAHFATMPTKLVEPCILAGTSAHGCCAACGAPWERIVERTNESNWDERKQNGADSGSLRNGHNASHGRGVTHDLPSRATVTLAWQPTCTCNADVVPCTVLDPFNGSGTTGAVALKHGRRYVGIDLNPAYIELSHDRIRKSQPMLLSIT